MKSAWYSFLNYSIRCIVVFACSCPVIVHAQPKTFVADSSEPGYVKAVAGDYSRSGLHNFFFGRNYRREWTTTVRMPIMMLDTTMGGLSPFKGGGGRQSMSLRLHDRQGREFRMRSIDKSFGRAIPQIYQHTFIEDLVNDQVTIGHPYSALTIPSLARAAKINHTNPRLLYLPDQPLLDSFAPKYGRCAYMLEQHPGGHWESEPDFGNPKKIVSTHKMLGKLLKDNDNSIDQQLYVRSRLFDMFIGDWGRHEDQWRWGVFDEGDKKIYRPIPRDRDQAYTKFEGLLTKAIMGIGGLGHLQSFSNDIKKIKIYSYPARHLDRRCTNEVSLQQWLDIAKDLQQRLTDEVIENAIRQLPPEVYSISGPEIVSRLKSRRGHLQKYAEVYYKFLARHVDIPGTEDAEYFEVKRINDKETLVNVYKVGKDGVTRPAPFYARTFTRKETEDIRLYGIAGKDKFTIDGKVKRGIKVTMIGGTEHDTMIDNSAVAGTGKKTELDDDEDNEFSTSSETKRRISDDSANYAYNYKDFAYNKRGIKLDAYYRNPDKFYVGLGYRFYRHKWRRDPYGSTHEVQGRYSLTENSLSFYYDAEFYQLIGKWNLNLNAYYDFLRSTNFFGLGNETEDIAKSRPYNRLKSKEFGGSAGLTRVFRDHHQVGISATLKEVALLYEPGAFVGDIYKPSFGYLFDYQKFAVGNIGYTFQDVNDLHVPTKGVMFYTGATYTQNLEKPKGFATYYGILHLYIPLSNKFSISTRTGVKSVSGDPEFYQYAAIGGSQTVRGFDRDRFYGNTAFYNTNELRYITNLRTYIMNGKIGLVALFDNGRVWLDGEKSDKWHYGYGGGLLLSPFNKSIFTFSVATSDDGPHFQVRLSKMFYKPSTQESRVRL